MQINEIINKIISNEYEYSHHADIERIADDLTFSQIEQAILSGEILEDYPNISKRKERCLIIGFSGDIPIHVVCGWRGKRIVIITVYTPTPPKFIDPWTRG